MILHVRISLNWIEMKWKGRFLEKYWSQAVHCPTPQVVTSRGVPGAHYWSGAWRNPPGGGAYRRPSLPHLPRRRQRSFSLVNYHNTSPYGRMHVRECVISQIILGVFDQNWRGKKYLYLCLNYMGENTKMRYKEKTEYSRIFYLWVWLFWV